MKIIHQDLLRRARRDVPLRKWLASWAATVESVTWANLDEVRETYPNADGVKLKSGLVVTVFNVKGNSFRLLTWIDYDAGIVQILDDVLSHPEYDKELWKDRF